MNEENNTNPAPIIEGEEMKMPENTMVSETEEDSSVLSGPVLFILAIILLAILGGLYYWFAALQFNTVDTTPAQVERPTAEENNEPESTTAEAQTDAILTTSPSDEISAIEADLEATNLDDLDSDMNAIDAEMSADLQ